MSPHRQRRKHNNATLSSHRRRSFSVGAVGADVPTTRFSRKNATLPTLIVSKSPNRGWRKGSDERHLGEVNLVNHRELHADQVPPGLQLPAEDVVSREDESVWVSSKRMSLHSGITLRDLHLSNASSVLGDALLANSSQNQRTNLSQDSAEIKKAHHQGQYLVLLLAQSTIA